ncbi:DUF1499 domain-containing protein [Alginatibacterium sediminis]|uniref:DUF1499 domain-containing protein n=1 Tax=Alginatibacterium sediminis TaxID=2164068 RepID=A0A420E8B0_9ALTE|nr:DUF1499 domain-containing protein [Alginatibacterium sediminis]RKF15645.1 DUF1499 domain-containing protein [Alginatibacterium sediminis]
MKYIGIIVVIVLAIALYMVWGNLKQPDYLGLKNGQFAPMPSSPNAVSSQSEDASKKVEALPLKADIETTKEAVLASVAQLSEFEVVTNNPDYMHIVFVTEKMRYRDDLELYFDQEQGLLHYRSQSRVGYSDKGLNAERYAKFAVIYASL